MPRIDGQNITRGRTTGALWFSILTGPLSALIMEQLDYMIVPGACAAHPKALWLLLLHVVPIVLLAITIVAGITAARYENPQTDRRAIPDAGAANGRIHFMAQLGLWLSVLSVLVLIAEWIPVFMLHPCWGT